MEAREAVEAIVTYCKSLECCRDCEIKDICTEHFIKTQSVRVGMPKHWLIKRKRRRKRNA